MRVQSPIHKACAKEAGRYAMHGVQFNPASMTLAATNGRILAVIPCEAQEREELPKAACIIPLEAFQAAHKTGKRNPPTLALNGCARVPYAPGTPEFPYIEGEFPRWEALIPKSEPDLCVTLDAGLLLQLAQALGSEQVRIELRVGIGPIVVRPLKPEWSSDTDPQSDKVGALMPIGKGTVRSQE